MQKKSITFFMLVTNRDALIACYSIRSYRKLLRFLNEKYDWKVVVYCNCLKNEFKKKYFPIWEKYDFVEIYDNANECKSTEFTPGETIYSNDGAWNSIEGPYESCDEIWSREFLKFSTDYWVTVDADFEILNPNFVVESFRLLEQQKNLVAMSSDHKPTKATFDSYSNEKIILNERFHTWFCIYKKEAQLCHTSHYYYEDDTQSMRSCYDSASRFQHDLRAKYGFELECITSVNEEYKNSFIHYAAFSKNTTIDSVFKTWIYRTQRILREHGLLSVNRMSLINRVIRKICRYYVFFKASDKERGQYQFESNLD